MGKAPLKVLHEINGETFVVGDHHLFHPNIIIHEPSRKKYQMLGYPSHEDWLIDEWNAVVGEKDLVLHVGDLMFKPHFYNEFIDLLNGRKILIQGNHDAKDPSIYDKYIELTVANGTVYIVEKDRIRSVKTNHRLANGIIKTLDGIKILFSHYPIYQPDGMEHPASEDLRKIFEKSKCDLNIHGHTHSKCINHPKLINVSVERIDFKPIKLKELLDKVT